MNQAVRHRPSRSRSQAQTTPQVSPEQATIQQFFFAIWPFAVNCLFSFILDVTYWSQLDPIYSYHGHPPPQTLFSLRRFCEVVQHLHKHDLVFSVELNQDVSEPCKQIDRSLHDHLSIQGFKIPRHKSDDGRRFTTMSWDVLVQIGKKKDEMIMKSGSVGDAEFTVKFLSQKAMKVKLELDGIERICECLLLGMSMQ